MFIRELFKLILQGSFLLTLAFIGHICFKEDDRKNKISKIMTLFINIIK